MNFGEKLKQLRNGQKLTQQQLAERIGVAKSVVSYYESGDRYPSYDVLVNGLIPDIPCLLFQGLFGSFFFETVNAVFCFSDILFCFL